MDLPTYTNIWRIEKRLYKLYDLRLPMPLPIVWIGVFVGVLAPWWALLYIVGVPFATPWHVVYLVPPGIVTWLSTRPVIENKRLTELLQSQLRYLAEPRTWCRMAPAGEPDEIDFTARVWRAAPLAPPLPRKARHAAAPKWTSMATARPALAIASPPAPITSGPARIPAPAPVPVPVRSLAPASVPVPVPVPAPVSVPMTESGPPTRWGTNIAATNIGPAKSPIAAEPVPAEPVPAEPVPAEPLEPSAPVAAAIPPIGTEALRKLRRLAASAEGPGVAGPDGDAREQHRKGQPPRLVRAPESKKVWPAAEEPPRTAEPPQRPEPSELPQLPEPPERPESAARPEPPQPFLAAPFLVSRTLDEPRIRRVESVVGRDPSGGWRRMAQVVVGGGGSRTDRMEIDEARARAELTTSRRIVVLGCTGGAGQTTTALMLGHTLARCREDRVLAVDANTGDNTLTTRIQADSPETLSSLLAGSEGVGGYLGMRAYTTRCESGLEVVGADTDAGAAQRLADRAFLDDWRRALAVMDRHYRLIVVDPGAALAARLLSDADQLVLVAPASEDAPDAVAMTYEWLDGHGSSDLRRRAVMVVNGVSRRSLPDVEQAEAVASGRCRAIVRVPWEDELAPGRPGPVDLGHLREGGRRAYVALAGVIASGLAANQAKQEVAR